MTQSAIPFPQTPAVTPYAAPALLRRMACFVYEGVLLFGVVMVAGFAYSTLTRQRHALVGTTGLQIVIFVVLGLYFAGFWSRTGQTLAMQTWQIRLVMAGRGAGDPAGDARRVPLPRAISRYLLSWLWFAPALLTLGMTGLKGVAPAFAVIIAGIAAYAALTRLRADRQYWHDAVCGTRLVVSSNPARV